MRTILFSYLLFAAVISFLSSFALASPPPQSLPETVVTAARTAQPLTVVLDAKTPHQPLPAQDGADYLKAIPGFSVVRKGGSGGDPVFRGMAGSRLNILQDGETLLGGCGGRMDPPTAYIYPQSYDTVTLIKGPQTVLYGAGNAAGVVLFERERERLNDKEAKAYASALGGDFGRHEEVLDARGGVPEAYLRGAVTNAHQGDYRDGDGQKIHSRYSRASANGAVGFTPTENSLLEVAGAHSDGEAAYADRGMDGAQFTRDNLGLRLQQDNLSEHWKKLELHSYYNNIDHVMDNYSLRPLNGATPKASNPSRKVVGGRIAATLALTERTQTVIGLDTLRDQHSKRITLNQSLLPYQDVPRTEDARFEQTGVFGEVTHHYNTQQRLISGLRQDHWWAEDQRSKINMQANPTADHERTARLNSGFMRYEHDVASLGGTLYAGLGHSERFPDYWELIAKESAHSTSAFDAKPEKTTQLDTGYLFHSGQLSGGLSAFYNEINDFLLIESDFAKPTTGLQRFTKPCGCTMIKTVKGIRTTSITRNVDAHTWGGEAGIGYALNPVWRTDATLAYVHGQNNTDNHPLAQMPPLESRFSLMYDDGTWSYGGLLRMVAKQTRVSLHQGTIAGQDIDESSGFSVFSLNASWRANAHVQLTAGIDNLLDKNYAEHLSRADATMTGYDQIRQVNEPGQTVWAQVQGFF